MMKKIFTLAVIVLAGASLTTVQAEKKNKKNKKQEVKETVQPVVLQGSADSLSYAAGYAATQGLRQFLIQQQGVDTVHIADVVRGYQEAIAKANDPAYKAYVAGTDIANRVLTRIFPGMGQPFAGTPDSLHLDKFHQGFLAGINEDTTVYKLADAASLFEGRSRAVAEAKAEAHKAENVAWLKTNATKEGVQTTASGLQYKVLKTGPGAKPTADQTVEVIYEGRLIDGTVFDATSHHQGQKTDKFRCNQVIKGWTEALTNMTVGSKWELYIPQELAYGGRQAGQIQPYSTLIFTVELVGIEAPAAEKVAEGAKTATAAKPATAARAKAKPVKRRRR